MKIEFGLSFFMALFAALIGLFVPQQVEGATVKVDLQNNGISQGLHAVDLYLSADEPVTLQSANLAFGISAGTSHLEEYEWISPFAIRSDWIGGQEFVSYSVGNYQLDSTPTLAMQLLIEPETELLIVDSVGSSIYDQTHFKSLDGDFIPWSTGPPVTVPEPSVMGLLALGYVFCRKP